MASITTYPQRNMNTEHDELGLFFDDDEAQGILDALAFLDDCAPKGVSKTVGLLNNGVVAYGPVPPRPTDAQQQAPVQQQEEVKKACHPYFYYRDFSSLPDPDPSTPITAPGRIPNFPAKMYAILSRKDLSDIITWLPHGRSWKVLKPREFEVKVIPSYFEHAKFSSFIRQANGWGFRRIVSKGADRNSYYHELYLRGRPHLIKLMRRPPPSSKPLADASTEPDFAAISREHPVPEIKDADAELDTATCSNYSQQPSNYSQQPSNTFIPQPVYSSAAPVPSPPSPTLSHYPLTNQAPVAPSGLVNSHQNLMPQSYGPVLAFETGHHAQPVHSVPSPTYHQQPQYHYHQPPPMVQIAPAPETKSSPSEQFSVASIHPVESTDSLLELMNRPLPPPETFGSHTFYPLFD
jgi:hypothetical protein